MAVEIDERWLGRIGGWQELKRGRGLWQAGAVEAVRRDGEVLTAMVRDGKRRWKCGMVVRGSYDVDNLCGCPDARREGKICRHSLGAALAWIHREGRPAGAGEGGGRPRPARLSGFADGGTPATAEPGGGKDAEAPAAHPPGALLVAMHPNYEAAFRRGRLAGRILVDEGREPDAADERLWAWLQAAGLDRLPADFACRDRQAAELLRQLGNHPGVRAGEETLRIGDVPWPLPLEVSGDGEDFRLRARSDREIPIIDGGDGGSWACLLSSRLFVEVDAGPLAPGEWDELLAAGDRGLARSRGWMISHAEALQAAFHVSLAEGVVLPEVRPGQPSVRVEVEGSLHHLAARVHLDYGPGCTVAPGRSARPSDGFPCPSPGGGEVYWARNPEREDEVVARLHAAGFAGPDRDGQWTLRGEEAIVRWLAGTRRR